MGGALPGSRGEPFRCGFRGGGFYNGRLEARSANWQSGEPTLRGIIIGLRVCAALPAK